MTGILNKKIDKWQLKILDDSLNKQYATRKCSHINYASRIIVKIKVFYLLIMAIQYLLSEIRLVRPVVLCLSCLINHLTIVLLEKYPNYQQFHCCMLMVSHVTFALNDPKSYEKTSSQTAVFASFIANNFLTAIFVSLNFYYYMAGLSVATFTAICYCIKGLGYS